MNIEVTTEGLAEQARASKVASFAKSVRAGFAFAVGIALPQLCAACREPVEGEGLCAACWSKLSFIAPPYCPRLGIPFPSDPGVGVLSMEAIAGWRPAPARSCAQAPLRSTCWCLRGL